MSITHITQLDEVFGGDVHREAAKLAESALLTIGKDLYAREEEFRLATYAELIFQTCQALLDDGGPGAANHLLKMAKADMRRKALDRVRTQMGPYFNELILEDRREESIAWLAQREGA